MLLKDPRGNPICECDFCGKTQHFVDKMIAGRPDIFICNECVRVCVEVIEGKEACRRTPMPAAATDKETSHA